ncbi:MAG: proline reductase cluster protein PrdD [Tissierellia bacterium]|nr:proline reductase cluster protein PrdD [Tissierellia bacterium]
MRRLVIKSFHIEEVKYGEEFAIDNGSLTIVKDFLNDKMNKDLIESVKINIIKPYEHDMYVNSIMDVMPISTKVLGQLGEGITHTLTGVYVMLTGADVDGVQMAEFGSSEGILKEQMYFGRPGTPNVDDYIIHVDVTFTRGCMSSRKYPLEGHRVCDLFVQEIRNILKKLPGHKCTERHDFYDKIRPGKKRVAIVKQIAGQGVMYDNQLFSKEPSGFEGGRSIIDIGNVPIILTPNEYRDGALRSMV